jgi:ATP-binding cassette subfamily B protein
VSSGIEGHAWPLERLGTAVEALALRSGFAVPTEAPPAPLGLGEHGVEEIDDWLESLGAHMGLEVESPEVPYPRLDDFLRNDAPALLSFPTREGRRFLALLSAGRRRATLLTPDQRTVSVSLNAVIDVVGRELEESCAAWQGALLDELKLCGGRRRRARRALLRSHLAAERVRGLYALRPGATASFWTTLRRAGTLSRLLALATAHWLGFALWIVSWWIIGHGALEGRLDGAWLLAWGLLLLTMIPFEMLTAWVSGVLAIGIGGLLKQRLLAGSLRLDPESVRHEGAGHLLGRVMESEALESSALGTGVSGVLASIELVVAGVVLSYGAGGVAHALLLGVWVLLTVLVSLRYYTCLRRWTRARLSMTQDMVEKIVGHRTRLAQERSSEWHTGEDRALADYFGLSKDLDCWALRSSLLADGWFVVGILGLAPALLSSSASPGELAVALGGILLANGALARITDGADDLGQALVAWKQAAPMLRAADGPEVRPSRLAIAVEAGGEEPVAPAVEAHRVTFRYPDRADPVLRNVDLRVERGERVLVEGASGSGKSTLASLLAGVRHADSGFVLAGGLDWRSLGPHGWRQRVVEAPQFQDNHVFSETMSFNLLMGRRWPPSASDLEDAGAVCRELGLGELLDEMPGGLQQVVGEGGWQLSHGERSRLFLARALLQGKRTLILDESFAALDPESLAVAMQGALERSSTLVLVAHP